MQGGNAIEAERCSPDRVRANDGMIEGFEEAAIDELRMLGDLPGVDDPPGRRQACPSAQGVLTGTGSGMKPA